MAQVSRKDQLDPRGVELKLCDVAAFGTAQNGGGDGTRTHDPLLAKQVL